MNGKTEKQTRSPVNIDVLLQDSYLLVVELRQARSAQDSPGLRSRCADQIEYVRQSLEQAGSSRRSIDYISYAQCALLDETVLGYAEGEDHASWVSEPLQAKFFSRHQAGEFLYEDMREVLREPAPDRQVLTAFQRVLMLGFRGRYRELNDPDRLQLLAALNAQVPPLQLNHGLATQAGIGYRSGRWRWLRSPLTHVVLAGLLLTGIWLGLDHLLGGVIANLQPGQA